MEEELEPFVRCGTENEPIEVQADEVLNAIAEERDIDIRYAVINGYLNIFEIVNRLGFGEGEKPVIKGNIRIQHSEIRGKAYFSNIIFGEDTHFIKVTFSGDANFDNAIFKYAYFNESTFNGNTRFSSTFSRDTEFMYTTFSRDAYFIGATFSGGANFRSAIFDGDADFGNATFNGKANFRYATFNVRAHFVKTTVNYPASFLDVRFHENTVCAGLKNHILCPLVRWLTRGKVKLLDRPVTDFSEFNTTTIMDGSTNPYLKRYIDDEQWIKSWRERGRLRKFLFVLWELTSHCGRSFLLWLGWSVFFAGVFAVIYRWGFGCDSIVFNVDKLNGVQPGFLGYLYYSVVTFTTLGFGDIVPLTNWARFFVGVEVVLGYVMLGGLISIFANKFARRS